MVINYFYAIGRNAYIYIYDIILLYTTTGIFSSTQYFPFFSIGNPIKLAWHPKCRQLLQEYNIGSP